MTSPRQRSSEVTYFAEGRPQLSVKNPAFTILPGDRDDTGTLKSIMAKSGSFGTWRALFR